MKILGIDPGIGRTGIGVVDVQRGEATYIAHGVIETSNAEVFSERLFMLSEELLRCIHVHQPACAAVEQLFFSTNAKTAMTVGMARGVILLALRACNVPLVELTPKQVKHGIAGWGGADKRQVQGMVARLLKLAELPKPDDAADALAIAIVGGFVATSAPHSIRPVPQ